MTFHLNRLTVDGTPLKKPPNRSVMPMDEGKKADLLYNILEKMVVPFEKLERLFVEKFIFMLSYKDIETRIFDMIIAVFGKA